MTVVATTLAAQVRGLCVATAFRPLAPTIEGDSLVFTPDLSPTEQTAVDRLIRIASSAVPAITPAEWQALEPDIAGLQTFQNLASPTLAQTVLAVKAQSRILRAILRS